MTSWNERTSADQSPGRRRLETVPNPRSHTQSRAIERSVQHQAAMTKPRPRVAEILSALLLEGGGYGSNLIYHNFFLAWRR